MYEYDMENPRYIRTAEGTFRILVNERFLCQLMLECAEEYLKIWIDACSKEDIGVYGAEIKRLPAGKEIPVDVFDPQRPLQWWIYDHKGSLIDRSLVSSYHWHKGLAGCFLGRDNARFRPGDIVEFLSIDRALHKLSAELGIVYSAPLTIEQARRWYENRNGEFDLTLDYSDDSYTVLTLPGGHTHVSSSSIRKPLFPIPDEGRRRLEQLYADKTR